MNEQTKQLARRVIGAPRFRLMVAMADSEGERVASIDGDRAIWTCGDEGMPDDLDLHDPATIGCLHALACEAWDCEMFALGVGPNGMTTAAPLRLDPDCPIGRKIAYYEIEGVGIYAQAVCNALIAAGEQ